MELFPEALEKTVQKIKEARLKPGIWFEIKNVGSAAEIYKGKEYLLKRAGKVLITTMRRFLDMRDPWVIGYLNGWQGIVRVSDGGEAYALFHVFEVPMGSVLKMELPKEVHAVIKEVYSDRESAVSIEDNCLCYTPEDNKKAVAVRLGRK